MTRLAAFLAGFILAIPLIGRAVDVEQATGSPPGHTTVRGDDGHRRTFGQGMVAFNGLGPERQRWGKVQALDRIVELERENAQLRRDLKRRWQPTVDYAYRLAAAAYGVSERELRAIGYCESKHYVFARNGIYRSVMQTGPMFERGPFGRASFSVWDPIANVMTAAAARVADGSWRQWECARIVGLR